jgi:hypothetical protein
MEQGPTFRISMLANSRFHHELDAKHRPHSQLEAAYRRADKAINQIVGLLAADQPQYSRYQC